MKTDQNELLDLIIKLMKKYPEMRFGQLVTNVSYWAKGPTKEAIWDVTNEEWIKAAIENLNEE